ncbi:MAG TPA: hypothetical protein VMZ28_20360 [Kofleriaceae bacterium]|nr:hypothetical protein [Kofleriaceae bacterium]
MHARYACVARAATVALLAATAVGCDDAPRAIDPFPIRLDLSRGPALAAVDVGDGARPAIIDTLSALTLLDPLATADGGAVPDPRRRRVKLTLLGLDADGLPTVPRARFPDTDALELHPCPGDARCRVGLEGDSVEFDAILGADLLGRTAARFDYPARELRFFPETAGTEAQLTNDCQAVMPNVFAGGGTLLVGGTEVSYTGRRPALGACLDTADAPEDRERGTDTLLLVSTGIGITILAASAYDRYALASGAPERSALPIGTLHLASGPTEVGLGEIGRLALVGALSDEAGERGPCRELYLNRLMSVRACEDEDAGIRRCPCPDGDEFCRTAAAVDLTAPLQVAVLDDSHPLLQSLRDELRPGRPEVDGILGARALAPLRIEFDYPNGRVVMRCRLPEACVTRPAVRSRTEQENIERCRAEDLAIPDAGPELFLDAGAP